MLALNGHITWLKDGTFGEADLSALHSIEITRANGIEMNWRWGQSWSKIGRPSKLHQFSEKKVEKR